MPEAPETPEEPGVVGPARIAVLAGPPDFAAASGLASPYGVTASCVTAVSTYSRRRLQPALSRRTRRPRLCLGRNRLPGLKSVSSRRLRSVPSRRPRLRPGREPLRTAVLV